MFDLIETLQTLKDERSKVENKIEKLDFAISSLQKLNGHPHRKRRWSKAERERQARAMRKRWKNGDFDSKRKAA